VPVMADVKRSRRERSDATRSMIVRAAHEEFIAKGFHGATIASIAERAGVAAQTVYFVFHNKVALINAAIDNAVLGEEQPTAPQDTPWWAAAMAEPDAAEALRIIIRGSAPIFARTSAIAEVLRAAARTDEELRQTLDHHSHLRHVAFREIVEMLASKGRLRAGLDVDAATDVLFVVYGNSTYDLMTSERHWTHDRVVDWLCDALPALLLEPDAGRPTRPRRRT
jgi:AcrR family transcriptional regulator